MTMLLPLITTIPMLLLKFAEPGKCMALDNSLCGYANLGTFLFIAQLKVVARTILAKLNYKHICED